MDLDVNMRTVDCFYTVTFYGALFREVRLGQEVGGGCWAGAGSSADLHGLKNGQVCLPDAWHQGRPGLTSRLHP